MDNSFPEIRTFFGFGCMRLPMKGTEIDMDQFKEMVDYYLDNGFNYYDTARNYHGGQSETAIREALSSTLHRAKSLSKGYQNPGSFCLSQYQESF